MAENQVKKLSPRHQAIMNYILANPTAKYSEVAGKFGVSQAWLSVVIHSAAFQSQLADRQDEIFDSTVLATMSEKLEAAADLTLDRYMEKLPSLNADQLAASADKLLGRLGFGSKQVNAPGVVNNYTQVNMSHVPKEVIDAARAKIGTSQFALGSGDSTTAISGEAAAAGTKA